MPFRLLALLLLILAGVLAWPYRHELLRRLRDWKRPGRDAAALGESALAPAARRKLAALGRADSVVLSAGDLANLIAESVAGHVPGGADSISAELRRDEVLVRARLDTRKVPLSPAPLAGVVRAHEWIEAAGPLLFRRAGLAEWRLTRARVRGVPLPSPVFARVVRSVSGGEGNLVPIPLPSTVGGLRVAASGLVLYGKRPAGALP